MNSDDGITLFSSKISSTIEVKPVSKKVEIKKEIVDDNEPKLKSFNKIGLKDWIIKAINRMEIRKPTDVQVFLLFSSFFFFFLVILL